MRKEVLHIEICRCSYNPEDYNFRMGDVKGSTESSNFSKVDILNEISQAMDDLEEEE